MADSSQLYDTIIIGGGVSGYAAALYAGRFEMKTLVIAKEPGGVITTTDIVENYPGFKKITGQQLADNVREHAEEYKSVTSLNDTVLKVEKKGEWKFTVTTEYSGTFQGQTIIFATGTKWKKLGIPGENEFANKGVHYCALCDGFFYKEKTVAIIGGSDSAAKEALLLTQWAKKVYMIYRGEKIRPEPVNYTKVMENKKIEIIYKTNLTAFEGKDRLTHVTLDTPYKKSKKLALDGAFVAIGHIVLSDIAKAAGVACNPKGEIMINRQARTNIPGIYAAGDVVDTEFKQAITGVGEGVTAAYSAYHDVKERK